MKMRPIGTLEERFWCRVYKNRADECWPWIGPCARNGYGKFNDKASAEHCAHRLAYTFTYGPIENGLHVMHSCDNPWCCNPRHLSLGTPTDNQRDCKMKNRNARGARHGMARLTDAQVVSMRRLYAESGISFRELGVMFGINSASAWQVVRGNKWPHLPGAIPQSRRYAPAVRSVSQVETP